VGKLSGRASRQKRDKRSKAAVRIEPSGGLKIVIATGPQQGPAGFSVEEDVRLVRSALLYADQVELISPGALMIASLAAGAAQGPDFVFELMGTLDENTLRYLGFDGDIAQMRNILATIKKLNDLPRVERRKFLGADGSRRVRGMVAEMVGKFLHGEQGFETVASNLWEQAGAPDLALAADAGLLTLSTDAFDFGAQTGLQMEQYVETLKRLLADPHSHLMFDEQIAGIVTAMLREERAGLHPLTATHALRAATGTGLVERLPAFPDAPMDAILKTRSELAEPLVRYRKDVIDLSAKLLSGPLEPALKAEVNDLWRDEVRPTLVSLRRDLSVTGLVKDAAFNLATDAKALVSGAAGIGVFFGVGSVEDLTKWSAAAAATAGGFVIQSATQSVRAAATRREEARTHDLYYLLAANDHLR
jgi:hypothetical protein